MILFITRVWKLWVNYKYVAQTWYTDNSGALGIFDNIGLYFNSLKQFIQGCGYCPKTSKIVLIVHQDNLESGRKFFLSHGFNVCMVACYLGDFIGDEEYKHDWRKYQTSKGEKIFVRSPKGWGNVPRRVTLWWFAQSNQNWYF